MFDSLKDKLGKFKRDVEEEAAPEEGEAEASAGEAEAPAGEAEAPADDAETPASDADAVAASGTEPDAGVATEPERNPDAATGPDAAEAEAEDTDDAEADDGDGPGLATRARMFATGQTLIEEEDLEGPLEELELALLSSDVEMSVANEILRGVRENLVDTTRAEVHSTGMVVEDALHEALVDVISVGQFDFDERIAEVEKPVTIVFTGVNGVGKTTTIAKLAKRFEDQGYSTVLANGDTYRAGANEQIEEHAAALDLDVITHEQGGDPAAVIYDGVEYAEANGVDVVLGDTAGRLHTSDDLMAQLGKIDRVVEPDMTLFVDEAVAGQDAVNRAREFNDAAETDGAVLTKADADSNGGAAISISFVTGKPILFLGTGQGYDDLERFDPDRLVDRLLGEESEP